MSSHSSNSGPLSGSSTVNRGENQGDDDPNKPLWKYVVKLGKVTGVGGKYPILM